MNLARGDVQPDVALAAVGVDEVCCAGEESLAVDDAVAQVGVDLADTAGGGKLAYIQAR